MDKLKGGTLVEVMVAMVLIAIATGIGSIIFMNISQHSNTILLVKAQSIVEELTQENISKVSSEEYVAYKDEDLEIIQNFSVINEAKNFLLVEYIAKDAKGRILLKHKKIQQTQ